MRQGSSAIDSWYRRTAGVTLVLALVSTGYAGPSDSFTDFEGFPVNTSADCRDPDGNLISPCVSGTNPSAQAWSIRAGTTDEEVVDVGGTHGHVWRLSDLGDTGNLQTRPHAPRFLGQAGETGAIDDFGAEAVTTDTYYAELDFRSATGAAQSGLAINVAAACGDDCRHGFVRLIDDGSGFDLEFFETGDNSGSGSCGSFPSTIIDLNLSYTDWHTLGIEIDFEDGIVGAGVAGNDIVNVYVNGSLVHTGTSWETCYYYVGSGDPRSVDRLVIYRDSSGMADSGGGLYFDNVLISGSPPAPPAVLTLSPDDTCLNASEGTLTVGIDLSSAPALIVGGQFFLSYDNSVLDFVSADPGDAPFDLEVFENVNETAGTIDYAVGVTGGGPGTMMDSTMAVLTFNVISESCNMANLVTFRSHMPPTRITDMTGAAYDPTLNDLAAITIDQTDPVITCPSDLTVECDESTDPSNTGQASATDNCDSSVAVSFSDATAAGACPQDSVITRTWTATDDCGNTSTCDQTITVVDTTAPVLGGTLEQVGPATLSHPGGGEANAVKYFLQPGSSFRGDLVLGTGVTYSVRMYGIDTSVLPGGTLVRLGLQDSAAGFTSFGVQAQLDINGTGGHLLQSFETAPFNVPPDSSHGFNAGDVPGEFDMRFDFIQSVGGGPWEITPYYRLPGDVQWSLFFDTAQNGPWTTSNAFNITEGLVFIDLGGPNAGSVAHDGVELFYTPGCPADITVNADAGFCSAMVDPGMAVATDNCDPDPMITAVRDDSLPLTDPYPTGDTIITWTATDACGNFTSCMQTITVNPVSVLIVDLEMMGNLDTVVERCIEFELSGNDTGIATEIVELSLTGTANNVPVEVPCGDYDCVTVRDPLHTLASSVPLTINGTNYEASVTGTDALVGGNLNDDLFIDILDFGIFVGQFGMSLPLDTNCSTPAPHADLSADGNVGTSDFTFIQINFLKQSDTGCTSLVYGGGPQAPAELTHGRRARPVQRISVAELRRRGLGHLVVGDLNGDRWLDQHDIAAFLAGARP